MKLNPEQNKAVRYIDGPLLVLAGAGSGKTRVITRKIAWLIEQAIFPAHHICAVTFTNKAANEMRERVGLSIDKGKRRGLKVATFHTLGLQILKSAHEISGLKKNFTIFDSEDCLNLIRQYLPPGRAKDKEFPMRVQQHISRWKNQMLDTTEIDVANCVDEIQLMAADIYTKYQTALTAYNGVDFDDLLRLPVRILQQHDSFRKHWQHKVQYLLVDEYQDSNTTQYELVKCLVGEAGRLTVVGDDDQSIYAWRGAKPENLSLLQQDFPQLQVIKLEQNYRSTQRILHAANHLISHNPHLFEKSLWSEYGHGEMIRVITCRDENHEAEQVIADLVSHKLRHGHQYGDYALLYRGNHQARLFEKILRQQGIPYKISGGQSWFARSEIKDVFAYFRLLANPDDDTAFLRIINIPKRGIGEASLDALGRYAQSMQQSLFSCADHVGLRSLLAEKPREALIHFKQWFGQFEQALQSGLSKALLQKMVDESGYEAYLYEQSDSPAKAQKRMDNVWELVNWIERLQQKSPELSLIDVINQLILIEILDQSEESNPEQIQLMTLHTSKGLEFPYVYLVGMEEDILPHRASIDADQIEEERRLAYVGITRAQRELCITLAKRRRRAGELVDCQPSRFIAELPQQSIQWHGLTDKKNAEESKKIASDHLAGLKSLLQG
jgi:ATP-dependent DNA helicase Rep